MARLNALWVVCMATVLATPVHAQWMWKDARGQTHMSDLPPPRDVPAKDILRRPSASQVIRPVADTPAPAGAASAASAAARVDPELEAKRKQAEQEQAAKAKAEEQRLAAARADNCRRAREHLATMESGQRVVRMNAQGEREFLDDKARSAEIAHAREVMASDCR